MDNRIMNGKPSGDSARCPCCGSGRLKVDKQGQGVVQWTCPDCGYGETTISGQTRWDEIILRKGVWWNDPADS